MIAGFDYDCLRGEMTSEDFEHFQNALHEEYARVVERTERQRKAIGKSNQDAFIAVDDIGYKSARIARADFFHEQSQGHNWQDEDFYKWWLKQEENQYAKTKHVGTKIHSGYGGLTVVDRKPGHVKFRKTYGKS